MKITETNVKTLQDCLEKAKRIIYRSEKTDVNGDYLVVVKGFSDAGDEGYFLAEQANLETGRIFITPKMFFVGSEGKKQAIEALDREDSLK